MNEAMSELVNTSVSVSVVIPCFKCAETIERAVLSVARQSRRPREIILVDDCGADLTLLVLRRLQATYPTGWIQLVERNSNGGAGSARNSGWAHARERYVAFLDADDSWHARKVELQFSWMERHPGVVLTGHLCVVRSPTYEGNDEAIVSHAFQVASIGLGKLLLSNRFATRSVMIRRDISVRFQEGKRYSEDYLLWLEIVSAYGAGAVIEAPLAHLYKPEFGAAGLSADLWQMTTGELHTFREFARASLSRHAYLPFLFGWSLLKHVRREIQCGLRRWRAA